MQYLGNREPALSELFDDHVMRLVMARDRLNPDEVRAEVEAARKALFQLMPAESRSLRQSSWEARAARPLR